MFAISPFVYFCDLMFASLICSYCTPLISVLLHVFIVSVRYSCIFFSFFDAQIFFLFHPRFSNFYRCFHSFLLSTLFTQFFPQNKGVSAVPPRHQSALLMMAISCAEQRCPSAGKPAKFLEGRVRHAKLRLYEAAVHPAASVLSTSQKGQRPKPLPFLLFEWG